MKLLQYLKARLGESSTWIGVVGAITGAAALPSPLTYLAIAAGTIAVLVPTRTAA